MTNSTFKFCRLSSLAKTAIFGSFAFASLNASAHFVFPYVSFSPGQTINGLEVNGDTSASVGFTDAARAGRSSVNLGSGEIRLYSAATGTGNTVQASGIMGDTLTFRGGAGTDVDFIFEFDALIEFTRIAQTLSTPSIYINASFAIFEAGLVDHTNWYGNALQNDPTDIAPLLFERETVDLGSDALNLAVGETAFDEFYTLLDGTLNLASNNETFDVFFSANLVGAPSDVLGSYVLDGENTALAGVVYDEIVSATSQSGEFLGLAPTPVPVPASVWLLASALFSLTAMRKDKQAIN